MRKSCFSSNFKLVHQNAILSLNVFISSLEKAEYFTEPKLNYWRKRKLSTTSTEAFLVRIWNYNCISKHKIWQNSNSKFCQLREHTAKYILLVHSAWGVAGWTVIRPDCITAQQNLGSQAFFLPVTNYCSVPSIMEYFTWVKDSSSGKQKKSLSSI